MSLFWTECCCKQIQSDSNTQKRQFLAVPLTVTISLLADNLNMVNMDKHAHQQIPNKSSVNQLLCMTGNVIEYLNDLFCLKRQVWTLWCCSYRDPWLFLECNITPICTANLLMYCKNPFSEFNVDLELFSSTEHHCYSFLVPDMCSEMWCRHQRHANSRTSSDRWSCVSAVSLSQTCTTLSWLTSSCTHLLIGLFTIIDSPDNSTLKSNNWQITDFVCLYFKLDNVDNSPSLCSPRITVKACTVSRTYTVPYPSTHSCKHTLQTHTSRHTHTHSHP